MSVPVGYSGESAIAMVRLRANEPTYPSDTNILAFLNAGVEQINARVGGIRLFQAFPVQQGQNIVTLSNDIQDIVSASFSVGDPTQNATVYPMEQADPIDFMDFAAGFPGIGAGPPTKYMLTQDYGTGPNGSLPAPQTPYVSVVGGTSSPAQTIYTVTTYVNPSGESVGSPFSPAGVALSTTQQGLVSQPPPYGNASGWNCYVATSPLGPFYRQNLATLPFGVAYAPATFTIPGTLLTGTAQPPNVGTAAYPSGGFLTMQLYPPGMLGQVNAYYRGRPTLWADTSGNSYTNLDTLAQEAVIVWALMRVLEHRGRADEAFELYAPMLDNENPNQPGLLQRLREQIQQRTAPKTGRVRDVTHYAHGSNRPFWY